MSTVEQKATKKFHDQMRIANRLLGEDGFYQLRDKKATTEQVHELANTCLELILRLESLEDALESQRMRGDALDEQLQTARARGFSGPDSSYAGVQERMAELERTVSSHERQREDERERMETLIKQRQEEWERAEKLNEALNSIVSSDLTLDEIRIIANTALA